MFDGSDDGLVKMEAIVDASNETIWAMQKAMAQLFGVNTQAVTKHLGKSGFQLGIRIYLTALTQFS